MNEVKSFGDWIYEDIHQNEYLIKLYTKLIKQYTYKLLCFTSKMENNEIIALLRFSDILSKSTNKTFSEYHKHVAQNITTILCKLYPNNKNIKVTMGSVLTNVNNYVGLLHQCPKYANNDIMEFFIEDFIKEEHRLPEKCGRDMFFNNAQKIAFRKFNSSNYYSFSGPTSMGKTFLMKIFIKNRIAMGVKNNFVIIVPSKSLINEIKNDLIRDVSKYLPEEKYKVITTPSAITDRTEFNYVMVYTQERFLYHLKEHAEMSIDYVFIDEAQKISEVGLRSAYFYKVVNQVVHLNKSVKIFFACPNIPNPDVYLKLLPGNKYENAEIDIFRFSPVNQHKCILDSQIKKIRIFNDLTKRFNSIDIEKSMEILVLLETVGRYSSNIVFCDSRAAVLDYAIKYYSRCSELEKCDDLEYLLEDIKREIHPQCYLIPLLKRGICYHVGYLPATIKEKIEVLYRKKVIKTIFCTSTLLEGVNLPADNLFIAVKKNSYILSKSATFKNLIGRVGRKTYNLIGNVFVVPILDGKENIIARCEEIISKPVEPQSLSIEQALNEKIKNKIVNCLIDGTATLTKVKGMTYEIYDLARFVINILLKSILQQDYSNRIFIMFNKLISKEQLIIIETNFRNNNLVSDDSNITIDQVRTIDTEISKGYLSYPEDINYDNTTKFLIDLHKLFNWEKYESKMYIGKVNHLKYYAVILNRWMRGESISQIINESIKYHINRGEIYNTNSHLKEKFEGSQKQINQIIVECLSTIENVLLFSISNYFVKFSERYKCIKNIDDIENDWSEFLDFGTNDKLIIALQKIGFTREIAKILQKENVTHFSIDKKLIILKTAFDIHNERVLEELNITKVNFQELFERD